MSIFKNLTKNINNLNNPNFKFPTLENSASIFKDRLFTREVITLNNTKKIKISYTTYTYTINTDQPINTSNLKLHYSNKHPTIYRKVTTNKEDISNINIEDSSTKSSIEFYLTTNNSSTKILRKRPSYALFNKEIYIENLLRFIVNNNLPFSIVNSNSFLALLKYLKDDLPTISRTNIKKQLNTLYNSEINKLKLKLSKNNSKFNLTLDEWKSSSNLDYLAITLHFYNNNFKLENYLIAFKNLNSFTSYTSNNLYIILNRVLKDFSIRDKVLAITKDNASPITSLIELVQTKYKEKYNINIIDNKCTLHILNIVSNSFLTYLFFIPNTTKKFLNIINKTKKNYSNSNNLLLNL